jgi:hypothetical protein
MFVTTNVSGIILFITNRAVETDSHIIMDGFMVSKPQEGIDTYTVHVVAEVPADVSAQSHMYIDGAFTKNPAYRAPENDRIAQLEALVDALLVASLEG